MGIIYDFWVSARIRLAAWIGRQATHENQSSFWVLMWTTWRWWTHARRCKQVWLIFFCVWGFWVVLIEENESLPDNGKLDIVNCCIGMWIEVIGVKLTWMHFKVWKIGDFELGMIYAELHWGSIRSHLEIDIKYYWWDDCLLNRGNDQSNAFSSFWDFHRCRQFWIHLEWYAPSGSILLTVERQRSAYLHWVTVRWNAGLGLWCVNSLMRVDWGTLDRWRGWGKST